MLVPFLHAQHVYVVRGTWYEVWGAGYVVRGAMYEVRVRGMRYEVQNTLYDYWIQMIVCVEGGCLILLQNQVKLAVNE